MAGAPATMLHSPAATPSYYPQLRIEAKKEMCQDSHFPCLQCDPHSYIRMVQHLIERCLILRMGRDECVEALAQRANIEPLVTLTVWKELLKENKEFFQDYFRDSSPRKDTS